MARDAEGVLLIYGHIPASSSCGIDIDSRSKSSLCGRAAYTHSDGGISDNGNRFPGGGEIMGHQEKSEIRVVFCVINLKS